MNLFFRWTNNMKKCCGFAGFSSLRRSMFWTGMFCPGTNRSESARDFQNFETPWNSWTAKLVCILKLWSRNSWTAELIRILKLGSRDSWTDWNFNVCPKILEYRPFLNCFHFVISFFAIRMTPKCETCKADLKKIAACKICWERKGTELAELQKTDIEKFWTKIPLNWRESLIILKLILSYYFHLILNDQKQVYCLICKYYHLQKTDVLRHMRTCHSEIVDEMDKKHQEVHIESFLLVAYIIRIESLF